MMKPQRRLAATVVSLAAMVAVLMTFPWQAQADPEIKGIIILTPMACIAKNDNAARKAFRDTCAEAADLLEIDHSRITTCQGFATLAASQGAEHPGQLAKEVCEAVEPVVCPDPNTELYWCVGFNDRGAGNN